MIIENRYRSWKKADGDSNSYWSSYSDYDREESPEHTFEQSNFEERGDIDREARAALWSEVKEEMKSSTKFADVLVPESTSSV